MKKALSLLMAALLVCGMATVALAAAPKINTDEGDNGVVLDPSFAYTYVKVHQGKTENDPSSDLVNGTHLGETRADTQIRMGLTSAQFEWVDTPATYLSTSNLSTAKISVKKKVSKGSNVLDQVVLKNESKTGVYIRIDFIEEYVSTGEQDFDFEVYLSKSSSKIEDTKYQITGTMKNEKVEVVEDDEEVDLSEGQYAEADGYVKAVKVDTGNGVFVNTKMFDGKKYYAKSNMDVSDAAAIAAVNTYPEIANIITLNTVNMNSAGNTVEFDMDDTYYVYNADGQYIGTTNDLLPMSGRYYLATAQIDMGGAAADDTADEEAPADEEPADEEVTDDVLENPSTGGDDK